jgi:proteasome-associated ATPase
MTKAPWHPAVVMGPAIQAANGTRVPVMHGSAVRLVSIAQGVAGTFDANDEVLLDDKLNVIMARSTWEGPRHAEVAIFDRREGEKIVLKSRDEEFKVDVSKSLRNVELKPGCKITWDRALWMALEMIAQPDPFMLGEVPQVGPEAIGGQDANLETVLSALTTVLVAPDLAIEYALSGRQSVLLVGPPGCGKTLIARIAAAEIARLSGRKCRFFLAKPGEWQSCWVGITEQRIRELFSSLREAAREGLAVLFLDEVESCGRTRGTTIGHHDDKALAALLTEIDGFTGREGVAIISATNRKDLIDPALLQRISDIEVPVRRPDMKGARAIFNIHLSENLPYCPNGQAASSTRDEIITTAVSRIYDPNSQFNEVAHVKFRDGNSRPVGARDLASGRTFEQICRAARTSAFLRQVRGGERGIRVDDIEAAVATTVERLASTLTVRSIHSYVDLPTDVDVVAVEPVVRKARHAYRYVNN